jgi:predicted regulator of Ras-like GTPase activity (Roadblock/LC7/MglB family)
MAHGEAQKMLTKVPGVTAVVVATVDGFDIASAISNNASAARIAALASSIAAISTVVSDEAELGLGKSVIIDTEAGFAIVYSVRRADAELVINVIANSTALLGQVAYHTSQFARMLSEA